MLRKRYRSVNFIFKKSFLVKNDNMPIFLHFFYKYFKKQFINLGYVQLNKGITTKTL